MRKLLAVLCILSYLAIPLYGDELYLLAGNKFDGTVIKWGETEVVFVLTGTTQSEAFNIPVTSIAKVILSDGTEHVPGSDTWISSGELSEKELAQKGLVKSDNLASATKQSPSSERLQDRTGSAIKKNDIIIEASMQRTSGYTDYHITFVEGYYTWQSVLAFPLSGYKANIKASLFKYPFREKNKFVGMEINYAKNLSDPETTMVDSDYVTYNAGTFSDKWVWSATQSTPKVNVNELSAVLHVGMIFPYEVSGMFLLGYQYMRASYEIFGVKGWQQPEYMGEIYRFDTLQSTNVLDYRVSYHLPFIGVNLKIGLTGNSYLNGKLLWYKMATANDEDDHILRYFKCTTDANGSGWGAGLTGRINFLRKPSGTTYFTNVGYELRKVVVSGTQTQTYYEDDPETLENEMGISFTDIDNELTLKQGSLFISLGVNF
jgi:hypothetical protein